jgi:PHD/YefM family antitoxin component YafN of YafNO toxin-antitoxin module
MKEFTTVDLNRKFSDVSRAAIRAPVAITLHRKARYVLMSIEDFEKLASGAPRDPRRVYRTDETPDELREVLLGALDGILADRSDDQS